MRPSDVLFCERLAAGFDRGENARRLVVHRLEIEPPHVGCCSERRVEWDELRVSVGGVSGIVAYYLLYLLLTNLLYLLYLLFYPCRIILVDNTTCINT